VKKLTVFLITLLCTAVFAQDLSEPAGQESNPAFTTEEFRSLLIRVNFEPDGTQLTPPSSASLDSIAAHIKQNAHRRFEVHGHSCPDAGEQSSTLRFSVQRVEAMVNYLRTNGVPTANIVTIINPVQSGSTAENCTHDRRVDIMLIETRQVEAKPEPKAEPKPIPEPELVGATVPVARDVVAPTVPISETAAAQDKQAVAIYMAGEEPQGARGVHNIMGGELARILSESDSYLAVDRTEAILDQLAREHTYQRSGAVDDEQIKALGEQLGVQYLCISGINAVGKRYYLDTRLVDVVTAEILRSVTATSSLKNANEMARIAREIALELLEADKTRAQRAKRKKIFRYTAIGLDILGVSAVAYGYFEDNNVVKFKEAEAKEPEADRAATRRNVGYIVGGSLIASGVTIHIFF